MQIHTSSRHLKLTASIQTYLAEKLSHVEHITEDIIGAHAVLIHDETRTPSKAFCAKVHLAVPGPDIHAEQYNEDLYTAIDKVCDKLARQLRKRKTRIKDKRKQTMRRTSELKKKYGRV